MYSDEISNLSISATRAYRRPRKIKVGKKSRPKKEYKMIITKEKSQVVSENLFSDSFSEFFEALNGLFKWQSHRLFK